jgi:hypothetical protein
MYEMVDNTGKTGFSRAMEPNFKNISSKEFNQENASMLFTDKVSNRCFGIFTNGKLTFRVAWHSDTIEPEVTEIATNIYVIGIDQNFVIVDLNNGQVLLKLELAYNFFGIQLIDNNIFVITELELIQINKNTFEVIKEHALPDFFKELEQVDDRLQVKCVGDEIINIL